MAIGNTICQVMMYHKEKKFDLFKVAQYSMYGLLVSVNRLTVTLIRLS